MYSKAGVFKAQIKSEFFRLEITKKKAEDGITGKITTNPHENFAKSFDINIWLNYIRLLEALATGRGIFLVRPEKASELKFPIPQPIEPDALKEIEKLAKLLESVRLIFETVGLSKKTIQLENIWTHARDINSFHALIDTEAGQRSGSFTTQNPGQHNIDPAKSYKGFILNFVQIADVLIAYAATALFSASCEPDTIDWRVDGIELIEARSLNGPEEFRAFADQQKRGRQAEVLIERTPDTTIPVEANISPPSPGN